MAKKTWGIDVIADDKRINVGKEYRTRSGKRVIGLKMVLHNSQGNEVTFPIKGPVIERETPRKTRYAIWTLDGRDSVGESVYTDYDLIAV